MSVIEEAVDKSVEARKILDELYQMIDETFLSYIIALEAPRVWRPHLEGYEEGYRKLLREEGIGDLADSRCLCHNPLELPSSGDVLEGAFWGLWYNDKFIRTPKKGWRIKEKTSEPCYNWKIQRNGP